MLKARPDWQNPPLSSEDNSAGMIGSRSMDRIKAAVMRTAETGHMTAPAATRHYPKKTLATGEPSTHDKLASVIGVFSS